MRTALITIALWSQIAVADNFFDLEKDPLEILDGHLQLQFPKAMELSLTGESALLDYGTARLTMQAVPVKLDDTVALCVAAARDSKSRGVPRASADRLILKAPLDGCAVTPPPPRHGEDLLFAAYVASADGVDLISFYVDDGGLNERATWLALARRIVATTTPTSHRVRELTIVGGKLTKSGRGWLLSTRTGWCRLADYDEHTHRNSKSLGSAGAWELWKDDLGDDAIATTTIASIHADCHAGTDRALARIRTVVETLHR